MRVIDKHTEQMLSLFGELNIAMQRAGGCAYSWDQCKNMTVAELIHILAPNNITFKYKELTKET
jgi:hypothetical protein